MQTSSGGERARLRRPLDDLLAFRVVQAVPRNDLPPDVVPRVARDRAVRQTSAAQGRTTTRPWPSIQLSVAAVYSPAGFLRPPTVSALTVSTPPRPSAAS